MKENNGVKHRNLTIAMSTIELLNSGVEYEEGKVRDFDIIDYYQITKISPKTIFESVGGILRKLCSAEEYQAFYSFSLKYGNSPKISMKEIMGIKHSIMDGDTLREITDEEKLEAIKFISENGMRLSADVYYAALKRELAGTLTLEENKEKVLTKK